MTYLREGGIINVNQLNLQASVQMHTYEFVFCCTIMLHFRMMFCVLLLLSISQASEQTSGAHQPLYVSQHNYHRHPKRPNQPSQLIRPSQNTKLAKQKLSHGLLSQNVDSLTCFAPRRFGHFRLLLYIQKYTGRKQIMFWKIWTPCILKYCILNTHIRA